MNVEYGRSNYSGTTYMMLVQKDRRDVDYQCRMVIDNVLPPFVPMTMQMRDSDVVLCLDISSRQPLSRLYERRTMDIWQIRNLLEGIAQACEVAEQYLMDVDRILLSPDYIFVEPEQNHCRFAFGFEKETTFSEELSGLLCYLLDHISREDYACVGLAYSLYQESRKETCGIRELLAIAMKDNAEDAAPPPRESYAKTEPPKQIDVVDMEPQTTFASGIFGADPYEMAGGMPDGSSDRSGARGRNERKPGNKEGGAKGHRILGFLPPPKEKRSSDGLENGIREKSIRDRFMPRLCLHSRMFLYSAAAMVLLVGIYLSVAKERTGSEKALSILGIALICLTVGQVAAVYIQKTRKEGSLDMGRGEEDPHGYSGAVYFGNEGESESLRYDTGIYDNEKDRPQNDTTILRREASGRATVNAKWTEIPAEYKTERIFAVGSGANKGCLRSRLPERTPDIIPDHFPYIIGKLEGATDHCPKSALISRLHARLEQRTDGMCIIDLNSTNGTFVNGKRLLPSQEAKLSPGDEIALADLHFLYEMSPCPKS